MYVCVCVIGFLVVTLSFSALIPLAANMNEFIQGDTVEVGANLCEIDTSAAAPEKSAEPAAAAPEAAAPAAAAAEPATPAAAPAAAPKVGAMSAKCVVIAVVSPFLHDINFSF